MPRLRALVALLLHVLLLHASVLGGGMACAPLWTGMGSGASAAASVVHAGAHDAPAHRGHGAPAHAGHSTTDQVDGDAPSSRSEHGPTHCVTAAGCVVAALASSAPVDDSLRIVRRVAEVGRVSLPPSLRPAPETPPPRA